jgi:hypothetical protein
LDVVVMDAQGLAAGLDREQFNWRPDARSWSAGQCMEHLNITARRALPLFEEAIREGRARGLAHSGPYVYGFLERWFLRVLEPPVKRLRVGAPKEFLPGDYLDPEMVMGEFAALHERARRLILEANGLDLARIKVPSAFSRRVRYSLGMGFWILTAHDRRHVWQARMVLQTRTRQAA